MPRTLLWKLLAINLLVVGVAVGVAAVTIGSLANSIFANLMKEFHIQVDVMHRLFVAAMARSLVLVSLIAGGVGLLLSVILFRRVVDPVRQMMTMAERIAAGDYAARARAGASDEIGRLAESLNRMAEGLQTLERLRKDLVANVAHELRTPLANLQGYLEAIAEGVTPASSETISSLHEEVLRLVRLVEALHVLSLFDARLPRARLQPVDMAALVRRLVDLRRVECAGEGIAPEDLPFIFERFYRGEKSRSRELGGAGIGLSIVQEVARVHGGQVGAQSRDGLTSVWLTLPGTPS